MVFDYQQVADQFINKTKPDYQLFRTVITCWDNTARRQDEPLIFHNSSPQIYQSWLSAVIKYTYENSPIGERFVFINAWNEWAEATHLEPDRKYGYAYLDATAQALKALINDTPKYQTESISTANLVKRHDTAVILHLFYPELWEETRSYLDNLDNNFDLYVSIPEGVNFNHELIINNYPFAYIYQCPNRGRDIAPFIQLLSIVDKLGYEYVCKIHTKKSVHREDGTLWRTEILNELLGSAEQISDIKRHLHHKDIGIIGPKNHILSTQYFMGGNETLIDNLSKKLSVQYNGDYFTFIAGSMFWFKPGAIATILNLNLSEEDFPDEFGQKDGTLAHAMERVIGLVAQKNGYKVVQTGTFTDTPNDDYNFATPFKA
jgi:lipopolysaccharide biosynthesis protein